MRFNRPKKLLCEMGKRDKAKFLAVDKPRSPQGRKPRMFTLEGETRPVIEWAALYGLNGYTLKKRINQGWEASELFKPTKRVRTSQQVLQSKVALRLEKERRKQEEDEHKWRVDLAIIKVLRMRESRSQRIDGIVDHQESVHYAIAKVLEMRRSRATRMRIAA